jgi:hypothetical protein
VNKARKIRQLTRAGVTRGVVACLVGSDPITDGGLDRRASR